MEQSPEWRYALHVSPTAATVATESTCCMHRFTSLGLYVVECQSASSTGVDNVAELGIGPVAADHSQTGRF